MNGAAGLVTFALLLGCARRDADNDMIKAPSLSSEPPSPSHSPSPAKAPSAPKDAAEARRTLLDFRRRTAGDLDAAVRAADAMDPPERFEERGEIEGKPYYMSKSTYPKLKLIVFSDGAKITNVVEIP